MRFLIQLPRAHALFLISLSVTVSIVYLSFVLVHEMHFIENTLYPFDAMANISALYDDIGNDFNMKLWKMTNMPSIEINSQYCACENFHGTEKDRPTDKGRWRICMNRMNGTKITTIWGEEHREKWIESSNRMGEQKGNGALKCTCCRCNWIELCCFDRHNLECVINRLLQNIYLIWAILCRKNQAKMTIIHCIVDSWKHSLQKEHAVCALNFLCSNRFAHIFLFHFHRFGRGCILQ